MRASLLKTHKTIELIGSDLHNLRNIDVTFPVGKLTLVAGVSGSGKSSLVDTLAAEAYRRMRRHLELPLDWPEDEAPAAFIGPLPACIHTRQRSFRATTRSTVATASGMMGLIRRLFISHARAYCAEIDDYVPAPSPSLYTDWLWRHYRGRATVWTVPAYRLATDGIAIAKRLLKAGFSHAIVRSETDPPLVFAKGREISLGKWRPLSPNNRHIIESKVGIFDTRTKDVKVKSSLRQALECAFESSSGHVLVELHDATLPLLADLKGAFGFRLDSRLHHVHPDSPLIFAPPNSHLLTFNQPTHELSGACPACKGTGTVLDLEMSNFVSRPDRSMHEGALALWTATGYKHINIRQETIEGLRGMDGFSPDIPWKKLSAAAQNLILNGSESRPVIDRNRTTGRKLGTGKVFPGFKSAIIERILRGTPTAQRLNEYVQETQCLSCHGSRWSRQALALQVGRIGLETLLETPFAKFDSLTKASGLLHKYEREPHVQALQFFAHAFVNVGLGHLSASRGMTTLSEGEARRVRLACLLNLGSSGLLLLLDEPSRGLHEQDLQGLIVSLERLKKLHTLIVTDHRRMIAHAADSVVVLGPGAGLAGGEIIYNGTSHVRKWRMPAHSYERKKVAPKTNPPMIRIKGGSIHNVNGADCSIPIGMLTCITGVSGSGKSSFIRGVLVPALAQLINSPDTHVDDFVLAHGSWKSANTDQPLAGILALDQRTPPPNRRSLVLTSLNLAEALRIRFGRCQDAKTLGLTDADFGLNAGMGRCPQCLGLGKVEEMELWTVCPRCGGKRFADLALSVRVAGLSISEVLDLSIEQASKLAEDLFPQHAKLLQMACDLGLAHLPLSQRVDELSGGELQRLRITNKLGPAEAANWLIVLDEPTAGLHPADIDRLLMALDRIVSAGRNTLILIEHNIELIRQADWVVDFGPGGGPAGGRILNCATPKSLRVESTPTACALRNEFLSNVPNKPSLNIGNGEIATPEAAEAWLRVLLGLQSDPPFEEDCSSLKFEELTAKIDRAFDTKQIWEIGGLNIEIVQLLLAQNLLQPLNEQIGKLAERWSKDSTARLWINPYIGAIQHWGLLLPLSISKAARSRISAINLIANREALDDFAMARVTGPRLLPEHLTIPCFEHKIREALALGEGFLELQTTRGEVIGIVCNRLLNLQKGLVTPVGLSVEQFLRQHVSGRCPMCKGEGSVPMLDLNLLIANPKLPMGAEGFFRPETSEIIRWIRRSIQLPFFRRLEEECLWNGGIPFNKLTPAVCAVFLWGFWKRPGHGSFLAKAKADPEVVASWLKWDGLIAYVLEQVSRSTSASWAQKLLLSRTNCPCPTCLGSGLGPNAMLLKLKDKSLLEWISVDTVDSFIQSLKSLRPSSTRNRRLLERVLECLTPLAKKSVKWRLNGRVQKTPVASEVYQRVVEEFTCFRFLG
jgi:excinuclease ABC A subunit